jgi:hypothetical protein
VIGSASGFPITQEFLMRMLEHYFRSWYVPCDRQSGSHPTLSAPCRLQTIGMLTRELERLKNRLATQFSKWPFGLLTILPDSCWQREIQVHIEGQSGLSTGYGFIRP